MKIDFKDIEVKLLDMEYAIVKSKKFYSNAFANINDRGEITVVIERPEVDDKDVIAIKEGYKIIKFDTVLDFDLVGFIAIISEILAKNNISIYVISSYSTDYILVKSNNAEKALDALKKLGMRIK